MAVQSSVDGGGEHIAQRTGSMVNVTFTMLPLLTAFYLLRRVVTRVRTQAPDRYSMTVLYGPEQLPNGLEHRLELPCDYLKLCMHLGRNAPRLGQQASRHWYLRPLQRVRIMLHDLIVCCLQKLKRWTGAHKYPADWSRVHGLGFFAGMGGFIDGRRLLSLEDIERLVRNEEIEYPIATGEEIEDKSKGDAVTKAFVVLSALGEPIKTGDSTIPF